MMILVAAFASSVFGLVIVWLVRARRTQRASALGSPTEAVDGSGTRPNLRGEVLFASREGQGGLGLDCLVEPRGATGTQAREPMHLHGTVPVVVQTPSLPVTIPAMPGMDTWAREQILGWLAERRRVSVRITVEADQRCWACLRAGTSIAVLDIVANGEAARRLSMIAHPARGR